MRILQTAILAFVGLSALASIAVAQAPISSYGAETPFKMTILGTRYRTDVEAVISSLTKSRATRNLVPSGISQNHLEYSGIYMGSADSLLADLKGLSENRYNLESQISNDGTIAITLRKIQPSAPAIATP